MEGSAFSLNWNTHSKFSSVLWRSNQFTWPPQKKKEPAAFSQSFHYCFTLTTLLLNKHKPHTHIYIYRHWVCLNTPAAWLWWLITSTDSCQYHDESHSEGPLLHVMNYHVWTGISLQVLRNILYYILSYIILHISLRTCISGWTDIQSRSQDWTWQLAGTAQFKTTLTGLEQGQPWNETGRNWPLCPQKNDKIT